jgi:hypothetical protein
VAAATATTSVCGRRTRLHRSGPPCRPFPHRSNPSTARAACPPMSGSGGGGDGDDFGVWATNARPPLGPPMPSVSPPVQPHRARRLSTYEWQRWRRRRRQLPAFSRMRTTLELGHLCLLAVLRDLNFRPHASHCRSRGGSLAAFAASRSLSRLAARLLFRARRLFSFWALLALRPPFWSSKKASWPPSFRSSKIYTNITFFTLMNRVRHKCNSALDQVGVVLGSELNP